MREKITDIEENIRTSKHRNNFFKLLRKDIDLYIDPYRKRFVYINCPNCNGVKRQKSFEKGLFLYFLCPECGTLFVNPRPPKNILDLFYMSSKAVKASVKSLVDMENGRMKYIFQPRSKLILDFLKEMGRKKGDLLEVGCSVGTMLKTIKEKSKFNVYGVDPSLWAFEKSREKGLKVYQKTLEEFDPGKKKFDVVLNFETIEHVFSPIEFLNKINQITKKGGYIIFTTPNYHGFDMLTLGRYYKNIHAPCHLNYFNIDSIDMILNRAGFKVVKKMTPGILDLTIVRKQIEENVAPKIPNVIKHLVFQTSKKTQNNFQRYLKNNLLSGNMLIFAKKIRGHTE
jgi:2-polyprenyl-3-methyl-5-hydroxy-6-metoxy-1,4-benzoquinol methylase